MRVLGHAVRCADCGRAVPGRLDLLLGPDGISFDALPGPGGIAHLQRVKAEAPIIVVEEGDIGVALRRLPEGAVQDDARRYER